MIFEPILPIKYIYLFSILFVASIIISQFYKTKNLYLRTLTFIVFLIFILNPKIEKKDSDFYTDIVIVVTDLTQSVIETKKNAEVIAVEIAKIIQGM